MRLPSTTPIALLLLIQLAKVAVADGQTSHATTPIGPPAAIGWVTAGIAALTLVLQLFKYRSDLAKQKIEVQKLSLELEQQRSKYADAAPNYLERELATPRMLEDMYQSEAFIFVGISNGRLATYLYDVIEKAKANNQKLALKTVDVVYAWEEFGQFFKRAEFGTKLVSSVLKISSILTDSSLRDVIPNIEAVRFHQAESRVYCGGSMFRHSVDTQLAEDRYSVVYMTFYAPHPDPDTKHLYTTRVTVHESSDALKRLFDSHCRSLGYVCKNSRMLFELPGNNVWDVSARQWDRFEERHQVYRNIMKSLLDVADLENVQSILDVACGTGRTALEIVRRTSASRLLLMDKSPQMISFAQRLFQDYRNAEFAVNSAEMPLYGSHTKKLFDLIICNMSLTSLAANKWEIRPLANAWRIHAATGGQLLLSLGNGMLADREMQYDGWHDPLRRELLAELNASHQSILRNPTPPNLTLAHVRDEFQAAGFELVAENVVEVERTYHDRLDMWRTPAILNSLVDVSQIADAERERIMDSVAMRLLNEAEQTMPTKVALLSFRLRA